METTNRAEFNQMLSKIIDLLVDTAIGNNKNVHASFTVSIFISADDKDEITVQTDITGE